ncbi:MAG TPA: glucosamine-6-phosphate deaminase [Bacteroides sp.]|nr:glucosamine-6-phosphate deaminase [Bacteroides sp.]
MNVKISDTKKELGRAAAEKGASFIRKAIGKKGESHIILATGASQFEMLEELVNQVIDWTRVTAFHLDEYIGPGMDHPASFRRYLKKRFVDRVPVKEFNYIDGGRNPKKECDRLNRIISKHEIDVAFVGIGENAHIAFNDPPADFEIEDPYIVVDLDEDCRRQQLNEGWFNTLEEVPAQAISMSVKQIMKAKAIVCSVPDARKAKAVKAVVQGPVTNMVPSSVVQLHDACWIFLDPDSAGLLAGRK